MKILRFLLVALALAPVCLASPGVGEFFEKLFGVFKPEGIVVTDAPDNATDAASNHTVVEHATETVITKLDNDTEVISATLKSVVVESLDESEEVTTAATTDADTTGSSSASTTTTVVYKLFHPNTTTAASPTTTTAASAVTTSSTEATENTTQHAFTKSTTTTNTTASSTKTSALSTTAAEVTTSITKVTEKTTLTESTAETTATSTISSSPESRAAALAPTLASTAIVDNVLCKTTYNAVANLKITSCADSTTPKAHKKRSTDPRFAEPLPLADTIQYSSSVEESYPSSSEIGDDDEDVFPSNGYGEYESVPINTDD